MLVMRSTTISPLDATGKALIALGIRFEFGERLKLQATSDK